MAIARPIPLEAPVTKAVFPESNPMKIKIKFGQNKTPL
jgi:hypothetical protein